jgi:hypothetical protein
MRISSRTRFFLYAEVTIRVVSLTAAAETGRASVSMLQNTLVLLCQALKGLDHNGTYRFASAWLTLRSVEVGLSGRHWQMELTPKRYPSL